MNPVNNAQNLPKKHKSHRNVLKKKNENADTNTISTLSKRILRIILVLTLHLRWFFIYLKLLLIEYARKLILMKKKICVSSVIG